MQEPQPLGYHLLDEGIDTRRVAARPGEADDKTKPNRVIADSEDDRDRRCCNFGCKSSLHGTRRDDHGHRAADQVSH
jgi:hypothetical protein